MHQLLLLLVVPIVSSGPSLWEQHQQRRIQAADNNHHNNDGPKSLSLSADWSELEKQPYFSPTTTTITVQEGGHAFFICKVENLYNQTVSWIRQKDSYMLYIGDVKFVDDDRFDLLPSSGYGDWTLRFRLIREADAGKYECQVSTSPKLSQMFTLKVIVPSVTISGEKEMHVESGSSVVLRCVISHYLIRPTFIFWYRDADRLINGIHGITITDDLHRLRADDHSNNRASFGPPAWKNDHTIVSILTVKRASGKYSGRYSCAPDNLRPAAINVHVIKDENPAAMQREVANNSAKLLSSVLLVTIIISTLILT